ncbi:MAG: ribonuclease HI family protein [bacterium]
MSNKLVIKTDGGARGNPGPAGIGIVFEQDGKVIKKIGKYIGEGTNNFAEYTAIIEALTEAKKLGAKQLECYLDSQLVVEQLNQNYKVKNPELGKLFLKVWNLVQQFEKVEFKHFYREENKLADTLVNQAIDQALK